ncbi:MAG: class I SAM-dependent methyltransferase, partial [Rhodobacteraceae bacterium]|nr:class I SAM-dependent methyltransferase [Paracoccaceae bacterium]
MPNDDPFTLDLFGNTSLSSGLGLGVTAFGTTLEPRENHDDAPEEPVPAASQRPGKTADNEGGKNIHLVADRGLARGWRQRAQDNIAAIALAQMIETEARPATVEEQAALIKFTGFGASDLANNVFRRPGDEEFRKGWQEIGTDLQEATSSEEYASLARCTQYAHFTPEFIVRAMWAGLQRLGWRGGRVLEPGIGTGLFPALMPEDLRPVSHVTGVELDPVTARIARLLQPRARIVNGD